MFILESRNYVSNEIQFHNKTPWALESWKATMEVLKTSHKFQVSLNQRRHTIVVTVSWSWRRNNENDEKERFNSQCYITFTPDSVIPNGTERDSHKLEMIHHCCLVVQEVHTQNHHNFGVEVFHKYLLIPETITLDFSEIKSKQLLIAISFGPFSFETRLNKSLLILYCP